MKAHPAWGPDLKNPRMYNPTIVNTFNMLHNAWAFTPQGKEAYYRFLLREWAYQPELIMRLAAQLPNLVRQYSFVFDGRRGCCILRTSEKYVILESRGWKPYRADSPYDPTRDNSFNRTHNAWAFTSGGFKALKAYFRRGVHPLGRAPLKALEKHPPLLGGKQGRGRSMMYFGYDRRFRRYTMEVAPGYTIWATAR
jgi:hypothetical protein